MTNTRNCGPGGRARLGRYFPLLGLLLAAAIAACNLDGTSADPRRISGSGTPSTSATSKGTGDNTKVNGGIGDPTPTPPSGSGGGATPSPTPIPLASGVTVTGVTITPPDTVLNAPAEDGSTTSTLATSQQFVATVTLSQGSNQRVTWSVSDPAKVKLTTVGTGKVVVSVEPTAAAGEVTLTATAQNDDTKSATAKIAITRNAEYSFEIQ